MDRKVLVGRDCKGGAGRGWGSGDTSSCLFLQEWVGSLKYTRGMLVAALQEGGLKNKITTVELREEDLKGLLPGRWLKDQIIDAYLQLLILREGKRPGATAAAPESSATSDGRRGTYFASTHFFTRLLLGRNAGEVRQGGDRLDVVMCKRVLVVRQDAQNSTKLLWDGMC